MHDYTWIGIVAILSIIAIIAWLTKKYFTINYQESKPTIGSQEPIEGVGNSNNLNGSQIKEDKKIKGNQKHPVANDIDSLLNPQEDKSKT